MDALLKPALPTCIRYSLLKSLGRRAVRDAAQSRSRSSASSRRQRACSYRVPVGVKVGKQTFIVNSDFIFLRKGRTEIYVNVDGALDRRGAADGSSRSRHREDAREPHSA